MIKIPKVLTQQRPWHYNSQCQKEWFRPGDSREEWAANMINKKRRRYLAMHGWDHEHGILYRYNQDGFRGDDFDTTISGLMVLGCSFTFGTALREEQTWPWIVAGRLGVPCYNLAWGGGSSDRCFRMAEYWLPRLRPKYVVMLTPPGARLELIVNEHDREAEGLMPERGFGETWTKTWITVEENTRLNVLRNQLAVSAVCRAFQVPCLIYQTGDFQCVLGHKHDHARDFRHQGPAVHQAFADQVYQHVIAGLTV